MHVRSMGSPALAAPLPRSRGLQRLPRQPACLAPSRTGSSSSIGARPLRPWRASSGAASVLPSPSRRLLLPSRRTLRLLAAAPRGAVELLDAVPGSGEVLSEQLSPEVRSRAVLAIKQRGGRVTLGDVASTAGLTLDQAEGAVRALAADSLATLQVTDDGEIVWVFQPGFDAQVRSKSWLLRLEPALNGERSRAAALQTVGVASGAPCILPQPAPAPRASPRPSRRRHPLARTAVKAAAEYAARVAFGTALIASVLVVFLAITAIATSGKDDNRRSNSSSGGGYYGGGGGYYGGPRMMFDLTDLLWYW